jgi:hypothetical protein
VEWSVPGWRREINVFCYWGDTGTGKTRRAFDEAGERFYIKNPNTKWWDGYKGEENVIIDEFDGLIGITYLLRWFDIYPCTAEIKASQVALKALNFWITSNKDPREWYPNATIQQNAALLRRMKTIIHFQNPFNI